jgi:hypothetical protein
MGLRIDLLITEPPCTEQNQYSNKLIQVAKGNVLRTVFKSATLTQAINLGN